MSSPLTSTPAEISECSALKKINLKGCNLSAEEIQKLQEALPNAKIKS